MKKFLLSLVAVLCIVVSANAQAIFGYGFSINEGTYNAITDGAIIALGTDEALQTTIDEWGDAVNNFNEKMILPSGIFSEETTAAGYPIGFDFIFNEQTFTSFGVTTNGAIYFGNEEVTVLQEGRFVFSREETSNLIGFVGNRGNVCNDETVISYKLEGEAPNRTLAIEFKNLGFLQGYWDVEAYYFDVQFRLYEGTNAIEFVVNGIEDALTGVDDEGNPETYNALATIGVKGAGEDASSVFAGEMTKWFKENATANTFTLDNTILDGTTFALSAPVDVIIPTVQATNLVVNQYSTQLTGSFTAVEGADTYLLVYQPNQVITDLPMDQTTYAPGSSVVDPNDDCDCIDPVVVEYHESWDYDNVYEFEINDLESSTDYTIAVYAVNSFGLNGPVYNTVNPPTVITHTNPAGPDAFEFTSIGDTTAIINLTANYNNNKIIVVYNDSLVRDMYGDYPLIGELSGEYVSGQEIEGGGKVAYFGDAGENIEITGLEHSKGFFFEAYSYCPYYGYSTDKLESAQATIAHLPYTLDCAAAKTYDIPAGWTKNEGSTFQVPKSVSGYTSEENPYLIWCQVNQKDATNGIINQLTSSPIVVDQRDAVVKFDYTMYYRPSRFATDAYNDWTENDVFAVQVSTDGETFEDLVTYNYGNHETFIYSDTLKPFVSFEGELAQYEGQQIWIRIHWHLYSTSFLPGVLVLDNFSVEGREIPETPIVKVENVTHLSAKVTWRGAQEDYEVAFAKTGEEFTTQVVEGVKELALTELEAETEYQVKVRGIAAENDYSYWSEVVTFTTAAWPECDAPTNLAADVTLFETDEIVTLSWEGNEEHLSWEVRYRDANTTSWNTVENLEETTVTLENLEYGTKYLWNVRAYCTADRVTSWSAQSSFETPAAEPTVPAAPVITAAEQVEDAVHIAWETVEGATGYKCYYGGEALTDIFTDTEIYIQVIEVGEYCFTITAVNEIGESEHTEACVTVVVPEGMNVPAAPVVTATLQDNVATLSWEAVEDAVYYSVYQGGEYLGLTQKTTVNIKLESYGTYCFTVTATNLAGESASSNETCVEYGDGVAENEVAFNVYPNPVSDKLFIEAEVNIEEISIYSITGLMIYNEQCTTNNVQLDVTDFNSGVYFVKVVTDNGEIVKRFVKK